MKKIFLTLCSLSAFAAASPALADINMLCDIGAIKIQSDDLVFHDGQFTVEGYFSIFSRDSDNSPAPVYFVGDNDSIPSPLKFAWEGAQKNVLKTKFGDIILTPITGSPRMDIEFPKPDYDIDGKTVINHNQRMKQQGCILQ